MGDAADDLFDSALREQDMHQDAVMYQQALDDAILDELMHLPVAGDRLRLAAMQVRAMLIREGYIYIEP